MGSDRYEVLLTQGAEEDLSAIHAYLVEHRSTGEAEAFLAKMLDRIDTLERLPMRGSIPKELADLGIDAFRQILVGPYRLIYGVSGKHVLVSVIADGRRDMPSVLEQRLLRR